MARIGMRYPVYRKMTITTDTSGKETVTYGQKTVMGKAISSDLSVTYAEAILNGDDGIAESVKEFAGGTLTVVTDDLEDNVEADLLGATLESGEGGDLINGADDVAPWVQIGHIAVRMKGGKRQYRGLLYNKVQFANPSESYQTKGQSITFGTPTMSGTVATDGTGKWRRRSKWLDTEQAAKEWLDGKMSGN
jgi:phi13 family phage major tail protein